MRRKLIVYIKRPFPGLAKTRLAETIGEMAAAGVYARLLYTYLLRLARSDLPGVSIELAVADPEGVAFFCDAFPEFTVRAQGDGDLGERMWNSFLRSFDEGAEFVVLTGSDIVGLGVELIEDAFAALASVSLVVGPASDGGYYLIGQRRPGVNVFKSVDWSTDRVLEQTEERAAEAGVRSLRLPERFDVDGWADLHRWLGARKADESEDDASHSL